MALQGSFFGRREAEPTLNPTTPARPGTTPAPAAATAATPVAAAPVLNSPLTSISPTPTAATEPAAASDSGATLTVGPNIKLKGVEITDCDTLVVEGTVEATMSSRLIQIAEAGAFKGSAEIDIAEIRGSFDGTLTVREKLVIHATGKVTGKIRYGKIVIEEGGQISGEISFGTQGNSGNSQAKQTSASAD